jgi:L-fucose mutarotase
MMLKGINPRISAELLATLAKMGHGDELVLSDRNYPAISKAKRTIDYSHCNVSEVFELILELLPIDNFTNEPLIRMQINGDPEKVTEGQLEIHELAMQIEVREFAMGSLSREAFYERAEQAFATVLTSDARPYQCFIITKGVI